MDWTLWTVRPPKAVYATSESSLTQSTLLAAHVPRQRNRQISLYVTDRPMFTGAVSDCHASAPVRKKDTHCRKVYLLITYL